MTGIAMATVGGGFIARLPLFGTVNTAALTGVNRIAGVQFLSSGVLRSLTGNAASPTSVPIAGYWCLPQGGPLLPGAQFDLYATMVSGTLTTGGIFLDSWTQLDVFAPLFSVELFGVGVKTATVSFSIRQRSSLIVVAGGNYELSITPPP